MADPLSITASVVAVITAAVQSVKILHSTVSSFKTRDKTLHRLQNELQDISNILESLVEVAHMDTSISRLLQGPIDRCSKICREFEHSMKSFSQKATPGFRDWAKMEFMRGDINEFIDQISEYKATISVGIGTITIRAAKVSQQALKDYNEMIQNTVYNLNIHLQRIDDKLASKTHSSIQMSSVDLNDEKEVTELCLRICEDATHFLESLKQDPIILQTVQSATEEDQNYFKAQLLTRQTLDENQDKFVNITNQLRSRLEILLLKNDPDDQKEKSRLLEDINVSKQCLEVCKVASEVSSRKIIKIGEAVADGESDQVLVTTLADLLDIKRAVSKGNSAQLVGSMSEDALRVMTEQRYNSRFGAVFLESNQNKRATNSFPTNEMRNTQPKSRTDIEKPSPNEMRKRTAEEE